MSKEKTVTISGREYALSYVIERGEIAIAASLKGAANVTQNQRIAARQAMKRINEKRRWKKEKEKEKNEQNNMEQGKRRRATA